MRNTLRTILTPLLLAWWAFSAFTRAEPAKPIVIAVSDVVVADKPLAARPAMEILRHPAGDELEAFSPLADDEQWVAALPFFRHPFVAAAHLAFNDHRPLALSPDMIWLLITQMAAEEVQANPDRHRKWFADFEHGKRTLSVQRDGFVPGSPSNDWSGVFAEFEGEVVKNVPDSPAVHFSHAFSTSTSVDIAARRVVLLAAASPYYSYRMNTLCGIPRIELHGTVEDWKWIRGQVTALGVFNMERRVKAMTPVLDEFVAAAEGRANPAFWKSFYKYASESGDDYTSGWINSFFVTEDAKSLDVVLNPGFRWDAAPITVTEFGAKNLPLALGTQRRTNGMVDVDFAWEHMGTSHPMRLRAGFTGVAQDPKTLTLRPAIAWQVVRVKVSTEETQALDYLGELSHLHRFTIGAIERDMVFEPETGVITVKRGSRSKTIDSRFWRKAFPHMSRLVMIDVSYLLSHADDSEELAICEAMLSAPAVKRVVLSTSLSDKCLRILEGRKDWEIQKK